MNDTQSLPLFLLLSLPVVLTAGTFQLFFARRLSKYGDWLTTVCLCLLLGSAIYSWTEFLEGGFRTSIWIRGWILPRDEAGSVTVGFIRDSVSIVVSMLSAAVAGIVLFAGIRSPEERRSMRVGATFLITTAGVVLTWVAVTPWLAFFGLSAVIFGGFLIQAYRWGNNGEATLAARFGWEKIWGLILSWLGVCILAGSRAPLMLAGDETWASSLSATPADLVGAGLLLVGLFIQLQSFPFSGWLVLESSVPPPARVLINQIFPAWAAFALLLRLESQFRAVGIFPVFGWVAIASAFFTLATGLLQKQWKLGLGFWISGGLAVSTAVLAFSGPWASFALMIGVTLGGSAFSLAAISLDKSESDERSVSASAARKRLWLKVACLFSMGAGTGIVGAISSGGVVRWIAPQLDAPAVAAIFLSVFFVLGLQAWKLVWVFFRSKGANNVPWYVVGSSFLLAGLASGTVWSGTATGGTLVGDPDRLLASLLNLFFGEKSGATHSDRMDFLTALWVSLAAQTLAFIVAYWTAGRKKDLWGSLARAFPGFSGFVAKGYKLDTVGARVRNGATSLGRGIEWLINQKLWNDWLLRAAGWLFRHGVSFVATTDTRLSARLNSLTLQWVEVPAKFLQLIQNGDVQWYLFFAVGSGMAILIHFLMA